MPGHCDQELQDRNTAESNLIQIWNSANKEHQEYMLAKKAYEESVEAMNAAKQAMDQAWADVQKYATQLQQGVQVLKTTSN